jgi:hypothetical protein
MSDGGTTRLFGAKPSLLATVPVGRGAAVLLFQTGGGDVTVGDTTVLGIVVLGIVVLGIVVLGIFVPGTIGICVVEAVGITSVERGWSMVTGVLRSRFAICGDCEGVLLGNGMLASSDSDGNCSTGPVPKRTITFSMRLRSIGGMRLVNSCPR